MRYESHYIRLGRVDDVDKLIIYLNKLLNNNFIKNKYVFILDTLLNNSELFVYKYIFNRIGIMDYKIVNDLDIVKNYLTNDNIIVFNWSSSTNYATILNNQIVVEPFNQDKINNSHKKYILLVGDTPLASKINIPQYRFEYYENLIFNFIDK